MNLRCIGDDNKMNRKYNSWIMIFFLTGSIFTSMFISSPDNNTVVADTVVWENEYGRLEVEPSTSTNLIRQKQYYNLTWYYPDNTVDIAFGFNNSLSYGQIYHWNDGSYNKLSPGHIEYGGQHYYTLTDINIVQDETCHGYWEYDTPPKSDGKWDMYAKLSSDSWSTAFSTGRIIHLDPWWDSDWDYYKALRTDSSQIPGDLTNFPLMVNCTNTTLIGMCQSNGEDIRFVNDANTTEYYYEIEEWTASGFTIWVNISALSGSGQNINMYYGNAGASDNQSATNVWDTDYIAVYHMNSSTTTTGGCYDSTVNGNHANYSGNLPTNTQGSGQRFDGGNDYIVLPAACWLDCTDGNNFGTVTGYYQPFSPISDSMLWNQQKGAVFVLNRASSTRKATTQGASWSLTSTRSISGDDWVLHTSSMYTDDTTLFVNGTLEDSSSSCAMPTDDYDGTATITVGVNSGLGDDFRGNMSEFRMSSIARSDNYVTTVHNNIKNSSFLSFGDEQTGTSVTSPITGFTSVTMDLTNITLDWTQSSNGNFTLIEYNTVSSWSRGDGTEIYNASGVNHSESNLTARTHYYFQAWAFNESTHNFSSTKTTNNDTGPSDPTNIVTSLTDTHLGFTWVKGSRSGNTIIMRKADSFPTGVGDGTEIYNSTGTSYNDAGFTTSMYYIIYAHNTTNHISSLGSEVQWGALQIQVYDENTSESIYNYTVFVTNASGSETYEKYSDGNQTTTIELSDMPTGTDVVIKINASVYVNPITTTEYEDRVYYYDIYPNTFYNISAYLPRVVDSYLYRLTVYGPIGEYGSNPPVEDATLDIQRYINSSVGYESVGIYISDGDGNIYIYLIPGELYKITITHDDYLTSISDYIPSSNVFEQSFRLIPLTSDVTGITYDDFWTNISVDIDMVSSGCWQLGNITITYNDINSSTTNTEINLFEIYGTTNTLLNSWNNASNSFLNINSSINTSRMHYISLYFNTTATYAITQPVIIMIPSVNTPWCGGIIPFDLDARIKNVIGPFTIGETEVPWTTVLGTIIPIIILVSFGPFNTGLGIIGCGISMAMLQGFLNTIVSGGFNWAIVGIGAFIVVIGILYVMTKGQGGDQL